MNLLRRQIIKALPLGLAGLTLNSTVLARGGGGGRGRMGIMIGSSFITPTLPSIDLPATEIQEEIALSNDQIFSLFSHPFNGAV